MTRSLSAGMLAHLAGGTTTICHCWRVERIDGTVLGFTELDRDLVIDGLTYAATSGFMPSAFKASTRLAVDNLDAHGVLDSAAITAADLMAGLYDFAQVTIFAVNYNDLSQGTDVLMHGRLGEVSHERNTFRAELRGLTNAYAQSHGQIYSPSCRADFGDARCGLDIASYTVTGTVESVSADGLVILDAARTEPGPTGGKAITGISSHASAPTITATAHGFAAGQIVYFSGIGGTTQLNGQHYVVASTPTANSFTISADTTAMGAYTSGGLATPYGDAGHFAGGKLTLTSGASNGLSMEVKAYDVGTLTLHLALPFGVAAGDTYSLTAGCGKRFTEDCVARFANGINFRGEPHLPGADQVLRFGGQ